MAYAAGGANLSAVTNLTAAGKRITIKSTTRRYEYKDES